MTDHDLTRTEGEGETLDMPEGLRPFTPGQVSGQRFRIVSQLGRGGMGEVWRAYDLKLRVEVALKALRPELLADPRRLDLLREEVRVARQVTSPNVCRIYDLVEVEGRELVSMEYVDGRTLLDELKERAPLDATEAQAFTAQLLSGLEAIHEAGLVHRDIKPENIMLTRTGRVVVMDFGIARSAAEGAGSVSGTPAYMAPEQARGAAADLRSDIFSVGVMLAEMVSPGGIRDFTSRQSVWEGVRREPVEIPQSPWAGVIKKAVAKEPADRFASTAELQRALEDLAFRVHDELGLEPYPGLAAFDVSDREYFFGREAEVEAVWTRLESAHLLAVVGASGVGKSSFLGAGVIPARPEGWGVLRCTPGAQVMDSLRRLVEAETGEEVAARDDDALVAAFTSWRLDHDQALLVIDQFEEVFTQNTGDEQRRVAALIGRLVLDADVHALLSLRDDFLLRCHEHAELAPVFSELTPLRTPVGGALRRAVVQPALRCGYRFEDEELADELLAEVEGERGALPLLAFALARLWERRDRESGLLTRAAYREIGGVVGALAQHAEATIDHIGAKRIPIVRELFRNLVTAEGTRAVREWNELLSVFDEAERESAKGVLSELIGARLLTSYEVGEEDREPTRRVEIIHESLLANWPRLVRWQTQDVEGAQLRDELRQAARAWDEHERAEDRLWTGTAFREYQLWRERYPGGLTDLEEAFARAMASLATRRRRRRRLAAAVGMAVVLIVLAVVTGLWRQSVRETRRAEAQKLLALGQLVLEADPTEAFSWAVASLEVSDTREGRMFALKALSKGPIARFIQPDGNQEAIHGAVFSHDGEWVALRGYERVTVYRRSGGEAVFTDVFPTQGLRTVKSFFDTSSHILGAYRAGEIRTYEIPGFAEIARKDLDAPPRFFIPTDRGVFFVNPVADSLEIELWRFGMSTELVMTTPRCLNFDFVPSGEWLAFVPRENNRRVDLQSLIEPARPAHRIHLNDEPIADLLLDPELKWIAILGADSDTIAVWALDGDPTEPLRVFEHRGLGYWVDDDGTRFVMAGMLDGNVNVFVWNPRTPTGAEPLLLRSQRGQTLNGVTIDPSGRWIVAGIVKAAAIWPLPEDLQLVFPGDDRLVYDLAFTPDGKALVIPLFGSGGVRYQPITGRLAARPLLDNDETYSHVDMDPRGQFAVVGSNSRSQAVICPFDGSEPTRLGGFADSWNLGPVAYDSEQNLVAGGVYRGPAEEKIIRVWNLNDGSVQVLGPTEEAGEGFWGGYSGLGFLADGSLLSATEGGGMVRRWSLDNGSSEVMFAGDCKFSVTPDGSTAVVGCIEDGSTQSKVALLDLTHNEVTPVEGFRGKFTEYAISNSGDAVAVGSDDGTIQVGRLSGGEPHILLGHEVTVFGLAFSPDGRLLASVDRGGTVRVWPVPDLSRPPPQALPHDELMAKLATFTNLRVVRDSTSSTGWKVEVGPFPGWAGVPTW